MAELHAGLQLQQAQEQPEVGMCRGCYVRCCVLFTAQVLKAIAAGERVIILDERGKDASSEDMARLLIKASDDGTPLCFVLGGPFGHGPAVMQRADESVRVSRMVLNHSVAYVVLVEQLYRAWTIVRGEPYHH
jgi:23S rRNA (pseudouridine1915-N3)-methyltransferase